VDSDQTFRLIFLFLLISLVVIRVYYHRKAGTHREAVSSAHEGTSIALLRLVFAAALFAFFIAYPFQPHLISWATVPMPMWLRWLGAGLGVMSLLGMWWVNYTLGRNFSTTLRIRDDHSLVTQGPYQWVRHPMYTVTFLMLFSWFLLAANWVFAIGIGVFLVVIIYLRTPREEAMMLEHFGEAYRAYMNHTRRFVPGLW
jgi:protein-S-isoprenylcysteine O-methyltransferase Ste14